MVQHCSSEWPCLTGLQGPFHPRLGPAVLTVVTAHSPLGFRSLTVRLQPGLTSSPETLPSRRCFKMTVTYF